MFLKILYLKDGMYQLSTISYLLHHVSIVFLQLLIYFGFTYMSIWALESRCLPISKTENIQNRT